MKHRAGSDRWRLPPIPEEVRMYMIGVAAAGSGMLGTGLLGYMIGRLTG